MVVDLLLLFSIQSKAALSRPSLLCSVGEGHDATAAYPLTNTVELNLESEFIL